MHFDCILIREKSNTTHLYSMQGTNKWVSCSTKSTILLTNAYTTAILNYSPLNKMVIKNDFSNRKVTSSSNYHWVLVKPNQKRYNGTKRLNEFLLKSFHVLFIRIIIIFIKNSWVERGDLLWKRDFGGQENRESDSQSVKESWRWPKSRCSTVEAAYCSIAVLKENFWPTSGTTEKLTSLFSFTY